MTYISKHRRRARARRSPPALSGLFDIVTGGIVTDVIDLIQGSDCPDEADASVADMDNIINDLEQQWRPTGFYTPDEINKVTSTVLDQTGGVFNQLEEAAEEMKVVGKVELQFTAFASKVSDAVPFLNAGKKARTEGIRVVNAPGLRDWVLDTMKATRNLSRAIFLHSCNRPVMLRIVTAAAQAMMVVRTVVLAVGGAALAAGEVAVNVLGGVGQLLGFVVKHLPLFALGGAGLYLYKRMRDRRSSP